MFTLTILIQHSVGSPNHWNGQGKDIKGISTGKVKMELFLLADDTTVKIKNRKYSMLKTPGINEFSKVTEYKIDISFLHN